MTQGRIYILRNPYHSDALVKIGKTTRTSETRAAEISGVTGVPVPFEVMYEEEVVDADLAERLIHASLDRYRVNDRREFFRLPMKIAVREVFTTAMKLQYLGTGRVHPRIAISVTQPNSAVLLAKALRPFRPGTAAVTVFYSSETGVTGAVELSRDWRVDLCPELITSVRKLGPGSLMWWDIMKPSEPTCHEDEGVPF